ncbi:MAG: UbiA prenyltransferase family protein [Planctomycetota bacterium]
MSRGTDRFRLYLRFTRPFTLLPPLIGMVSGSVTALGALAHRQEVSLAEVRVGVEWGAVLLNVALGALLAAALNAGSNILNQWTDIENDRINKPHRPLPSGRVTIGETLALTLLFYLLSLLFAAAVRPEGRLHTLWVVAGGALMTLVYSVPPARTKRFGIWANITIATARGCLLKVAGWSCVAAIFPDPEPWFIGGVFALFLVGASTTKDYADMDGDRAAGCRTWPIRYGTHRSARMIAPFFILPWLLIPVGCRLPAAGRATLLTGNPTLLTALALLLAAYGVFIVRGILKDPDALARSENHPSWTHMYLQMMLAQVGLMVAYVF